MAWDPSTTYRRQYYASSNLRWLFLSCFCFYFLKGNYGSNTADRTPQTVSFVKDRLVVVRCFEKGNAINCGRCNANFLKLWLKTSNSHTNAVLQPPAKRASSDVNCSQIRNCKVPTAAVTVRSEMRVSVVDVQRFTGTTK